MVYTHVILKHDYIFFRNIGPFRRILGIGELEAVEENKKPQNINPLRSSHGEIVTDNDTKLIVLSSETSFQRSPSQKPHNP